jgi:hypothetical protein
MCVWRKLLPHYYKYFVQILSSFVTTSWYNMLCLHISGFLGLNCDLIGYETLEVWYIVTKISKKKTLHY